jgi:hypothetical protein
MHERLVPSNQGNICLRIAKYIIFNGLSKWFFANGLVEIISQQGDMDTNHRAKPEGTVLA